MVYWPFIRKKCKHFNINFFYISLNIVVKRAVPKYEFLKFFESILYSMFL